MVRYKQGELLPVSDARFEEDGEIISLIVGGEKIGYINYGTCKGHMEIKELYVEEDFRNRGYGKELMRYALKEPDLVEVRLHIRPVPRKDGSYDMTKQQLMEFYENFAFGMDNDMSLIFSL